MNTAMRESAKRTQGQGGFVLVGLLVALGALAGGHLLMMRSGPDRPAEGEFGLGPRTSASGMYTATLAASQPLKPRVMQTLTVRVVNEHGQAVDDAQIAIDGGMPQHGHGLPTRPRVTKNVGNGVYEIEGVRFNMRGWWEFKLSVKTESGTDFITFNLNL